MQIVSGKKSASVSSTDALLAMLSMDLKITNEIWLYESDTKNPALSILTSGDCFYACFFPAAGHPGFNSLTRESNLHQKEDAVFSLGGQAVEISRKYLISRAEAVAIAEEFFLKKAFPTCIDWEEL